MKNNLTTRQMVNAELAARTSNEQSAEKLKRHIPELELESAKIAFVCECYDQTCEHRILLTLEEYAYLHNKFSHFVIAKGHDEPIVEKVIAEGNSLSIVEKYCLPDSTNK